MQSFEDVRAAVVARHQLATSEPYLISFDASVQNGQRVQGMYLAELETEDGQRVLRISTPIARLGRVNTEKCLRFNWAQRAGFLAAGNLDGKDYLHLCENRTYSSLDAESLDRLLGELANLADQLESVFNDGQDVT
jgi:hypothetical protein